jgi:hypothetical protein
MKLAKNEAICNRTKKRENTKSIESNISGVGGVKRVCQLDHAQRLGVLQVSIERSSKRRIDKIAAAEIEVAQPQPGAYHHMHITYGWTGVVQHVPAPHHEPSLLPVLVKCALLDQPSRVQFLLELVK